MKKIIALSTFVILFSLSFTLPVVAFTPSDSQGGLKHSESEIPAPATAEVFFTSDISGQGVMKVFSNIQEYVQGTVAVKVHFGEEGNANYIKPAISRTLVEHLKATYVETNVLYSSPRQKTESHIALARKHGFDFAPIDILDSEGELIYPCDTSCYSRVLVGNHMPRYGTYVVFSHFKGHSMAGFGGAIKNVSMGFASRMGKKAMHSNYVPETNNEKCISCGLCLNFCPESAISINPLKVDSRKCIGCGQCLTECPVKAFESSRSRIDLEVFNRRLVEYANVISKKNHMLYINILSNISPDCDCFPTARKPFTKDIGILASTDIVAIEQASLDMVNKAHKCADAFLKESGRSGNSQIDFAVELGMGTRHYNLVNVEN